jgi:hypothetical protein
MGPTAPPDSSAAHLLSRASFRQTMRDFVPRGAILFCFYLFFALLLVTRRFDCAQNPQFWAEEGQQFFADALEHPAWLNLTNDYLGYFYLSIRLISQIGALVPLQYAPLVFVLSALAIQASVPALIVSSRCAALMGPFPVRLAAALLYCGMPNSFEVHCIALSSRVHLVVLAALVIVSTPPRSLSGKLLDSMLLVLVGLSGPQVLILAPVAAWRYWRERTAATRRNCLIFAVTSCCAIFALIHSMGSRLALPLGASPAEGMRIIGGQFTLGFLLGVKTYGDIVQQPRFDLAAGTGVLVLALLVSLMIWRGTVEMRALLFIGFGALAMALISPIGAVDMSQWHALWSIPGNGQRYYLVPMAMLLFSLAVLVGRGNAPLCRAIGATFLLLIAAMGARVDWVLTPTFTDFHFRHYVDLYRSLPPGASVIVPINPPGWNMELKKTKLNER